MPKEKEPASPDTAKLEQALMKAFYEGLKLPRRGEDASGRTHIVFEIDILIEDGRLVHAIVREVGAGEEPPAGRKH